jgi:hypothetical protein
VGPPRLECDKCHIRWTTPSRTTPSNPESEYMKIMSCIWNWTWHLTVGQNFVVFLRAARNHRDVMIRCIGDKVKQK